jgi:hypothetical protein
MLFCYGGPPRQACRRESVPTNFHLRSFKVGFSRFGLFFSEVFWEVGEVQEGEEYAFF